MRTELTRIAACLMAAVVVAGTSDTAGRVGELPVTFVVRSDGLTFWEAPSEWVEAGR